MEVALAVRRSVFEADVGWADEFFYMHEGVDLAWAVWADGGRVRYADDIVAWHPAVSNGQHDNVHRFSMRNRVFLARRRLPLPLAVIYVSVWLALTVVRERTPAAIAASFSGIVEGVRGNAGPRRPMSWRTVWRMTRAGRPPII